MHSVKVNRNELLDIVKRNKEKHVAEFNEAVEDYKKAAVKVMTENLSLATTGELESIAKIKPLASRPNSYETSYERAIRMLELSVEDVIEVEEDVFNQLVLDEWEWKASFTTTNTFYKTMSV